MKFSSLRVGSLILCISFAYPAAASDTSAATTAGKFIDALQHQHLKEAAAMFATAQAQNISAIERNLEKIGASLGGFSAMHPIPMLPDGKSIKFEVPGYQTVVPNVQKFRQVRYASIARDGQPVFYELNLTDDDTSPRVLSFGVHFPASDPQSTARADHLLSLIKR